MSRSFLFLQGVASPFFSKLGESLIAAGHEVVKINFCGGDLFSGRFFSTALKHINYRGKLTDLDDFYQATFKTLAITDVVLFGDTRPIHASALSFAKKNNINIHVYEEGYFRPDWVTLDKDGVNANSQLSTKPDDYNRLPNIEPLKANETGGGLAIRAWHDIRYHAANLLFKFYFPFYQSHRPERALKEYWGWFKRMPSLYFYYNKLSQQKISTLLLSQKPFYILPLQLDADSQMRIHSPIKTVTQVIQTTLKSFAKNAPQESALVIKAHPLDPWFVNYSHIINAAAKTYNVDQSRIIYLESGDLNALLVQAKGTVLVNSTVGTTALSMGCPVIALGSAIYDMDGLTFQGSLDDFWRNASPPDKSLFDKFKHAIIQSTQINGSFYNHKGISMAVTGSLEFFNSRNLIDQKQAKQKKNDNIVRSAS